MEAKTPKGAKAWLDLLSHGPFPILQASAKLLTKQIKDGASLADMAHTVERDPALCLHLFLAANKLNQNPDVEIQTLNHVITVLGMQGVVKVVKQAPQIQLHSSDAFQLAYLQAQANSSFAGQLAQAWADPCHVGNGEKLKWATIISGAPIWLMWRLGYGPMRQWQWCTEHDRKGRESCEQAIFGCALDDIYRMCGRRLQLPSLAMLPLERAQRPNLKQWAKIMSPRFLDYLDQDGELKHLKSNASTLMSLLMHLSQHLPLGWMNHKGLRAQKALAQLSGKSLDSVVHKNHQLAVNFSRSNLATPVLQPAVSLLWPQLGIQEKGWLRKPYSCWLKDPNPNRQTDKVLDKKNADIEVPAKQPPRQPNKDLIVELIAQFNKQVASFKDIHEILLTCNKAIHDGLGMRRTFICVLNKSGEVLRPLYCVGIADNSPLRAMTIKLDSNRFFSKLLQQTASFKVDHDNYAQVKHMLHKDVVDSLANENFMAMSLFANGKPIGVVYADASQEEDRISDKEYMAFKKICQSASFALDSYAQKRHAS